MKQRNWLLTAMLAGAVCAAQSAWTMERGGVVDSGGGDVFVCAKRNFIGWKTEEVFLADTYSLQKTPAFELFEKLNEAATEAELLNAAIIAAGSLDADSTEYLRTVLSPESPTRIIFRMSQQQLPELDDDDIIVPAGCQKRQLAIQRLTVDKGGTHQSEVVIQQDYFSKLTRAEQILFYVHEGFIRKRLETENPVDIPNTAHIRSKVAAASQQKSFSFLAEAVASFSGDFGPWARDVYHTIVSGQPERVTGHMLLGGRARQIGEAAITAEDVEEWQQLLAGRIIGAEAPGYFSTKTISLSACGRSGRSICFGLAQREGTFSVNLYDVETRETLLKLRFEVGMGGISSLKGVDRISYPVRNGRIACGRPRVAFPLPRKIQGYPRPTPDLDQYPFFEMDGRLMFECRSEKTLFRGEQVVFAVSGDDFFSPNDRQSYPTYYFTSDGRTVPLPHYRKTNLSSLRDLNALCASPTRPDLLKQDTAAMDAIEENNPAEVSDGKWIAKGGAKLILPSNLTYNHQNRDFTAALVLEIENSLRVFNKDGNGWPIRTIVDQESSYRMEIPLQCKATILPPAGKELLP